MSYRDDAREVQKETLWTMPRVFFLVLVILIGFYGLGFVATGGDLAIYRFWAPKQENAKRVVFENTQSYIQGKQEYLSRLEFQYKTADNDTQKAALKTMILDESSTVDMSQMSSDVQS